MLSVSFNIFISAYRAFTVTAIAQLCVLGIMWVFGCFQFNKDTLAMSYIFTILSSLQGVLMFTRPSSRGCGNRTGADPKAARGQTYAQMCIILISVSKCISSASVETA